MVKDFKGNIDIMIKQRGNLSKKVENTQENQMKTLKLKNTVAEMKTSPEGITVEGKRYERTVNLKVSQ